MFIIFLVLTTLCFPPWQNTQVPPVDFVQRVGAYEGSKLHWLVDDKIFRLVAYFSRDADINITALTKEGSFQWLLFRPRSPGAFAVSRSMARLVGSPVSNGTAWSTICIAAVSG